MPELKPLYKLYKGLKANNYDVPDSYASFERTLCAPGNEGARNRRTIYNALKKQNFDVPDSYESFYRTLFKPVSRTTSIAIGSPVPKQTARPAAPARPQSARPAAKKPVQPAGKGTPMTAAQKQAAVAGVNNLVGNATAGLQRTMNQMDYARATSGLQATPPRLGQQGTVVRRDAKGNVEKVAPSLNQLPELDAQDVGATYLTAAGSEYTDRTQAENEQMQLTRQEKAREANQNREALLRRQRAEVVEKMMARGKELDQEALQFSWRDMPRGAGGAVHTWNSSSANGRFFDKTYKTYMAQLNQIDDALAAIEEGKKGRESDAWIGSSSNWFTRAGKNLLAFGAGALRGLNHAVGKVSTWDMGMTDNNTNMALLDAARNAKKNGFAHISAEEQRLLTLAAESRLAQEENKAYIGWGYQTGEIAGESLPFMLEMRINPLSNTGNVAVKQLTKWAMKHYGKEALKKASRKYAAMKIGARVLGDIAGSAGMTATTGQGHVTADALRRLTGDVKYKEDAEGNIVYDGTEGAEDSVLTAYLKAFGAQTIENHSEMVGEYFAPFLGKVGKLARKGMAKVGLDSVSRFIDTVGATNFSRMISDFERQTKWNGTIGEYAEEVVGNIENALLVGDNTLDTAEGTGVFNLEQNIVTFLGVGLMGAAISGAKTASYRGPKRRALNAMNEAGRAVDRAVAESPYWMDKWGGWRNTLLVGTPEEKTAALVDALSDKELPMGFRQAILDYAKAAQEYTGLCQMQRSRQEDGTQDPIAAAYDASYDKGYGTTDRDAMNSAKNRLWLQREAVARELGLESADQVDEAIGDPLEYIEAQRQAGKQPGELQTVIDYANAKSEWDGMVARVRDEIDDKVAAEHREIDRQVNPSDGMIHRATLKAKTVDGEDQQVYVVSGKVVMEEDGSGVDLSQSDESVVVRDAKTGELSQVSPDALLRVDAVVDPAEEKQQAEQAISEEMARSAADDIDGTVAFAAGDEYILRAEDGSEQTVRMVANEQGVVDNGDGTVNVTVDGKTVMQMDKAAIQRGVDAARRAQAATELAQEKADETSEAPSDTATEAEGAQPTSDTAEQATDAEGEAPAEAPTEEGKQEAAAVPEYGANDNFTLTLADGTPVRGTVQAVTADGVEVWTETPVDGQRVQVLPREEFEGMLNRLEDADGNPVWSRADGSVAQQEEETPVATDEQEAGTEEEQTASDEARPVESSEGEAAPVDAGTESVEDGTATAEDGTEATAESAENKESTGTSNNNESALSRVPKNEKGEPVYEQTDAETAWDAIVEQTGGNGEMARTVADSMVADKEAALKKAEKAKPRKGGTVAEKIAAEQERLAAIEQAKQDLAHWQKIAGVEQQRKEAAAEAERAKAENAQGESVGLSDNDAADLMSQMEANAAEMPQMELNPTNWEREFGEEGTVATPIGQVKMGENQIAKLFEKGRSEQFGMIKPTLEHPQVIIEVPSEAIDGNAERNSSLLFVKTFIGKNGKKIYYFKSVTVKKDGLEVSVSSHYDRAKRINEALKNGKLLYRFDGGAQTEHHPAGASVTTPQEKEQGSSEGKGNQKSGTTQESETKNLSEQEALRGVPDWVEDTPQAARRRGYRRSNGARYDRQGELVDGDFKPVAEAKDGRGVAVGKAVEVKFSDRDKQAGHVVVMEAEQLQPSHQGGRANVLHFIPEAQPKARTDEASVLSSERIAAHINPEEITSSVTAYTGAPTVNARGEVIQGNNRSAALKTMWTGHAAEGEKYKQYLMDHAAEFGLKAEDIAEMVHPVLVNMAAVDDERAVELGQYDVKDTESGGQERIKPRNAAMKMGADMQTFASMLLKSEDEDASFSQLVDRNGLDVLQWMQTKGYISATQYKSGLNSRGDLTAEASNDLKGILYQSIFQNGSERLEEMFNALPVKAQRAILGTAYRDYDSPETERMVPEIQQSIMAYHELMQDEAFASAKNMKDAQMALMMWQRQYKMDDATGESYLPTEKYSNFALQLAAMYKVQTQRMVQGTFNHLYDLIQGTQEADLFNQDTLDNTPRTLVEAIKEALNIDYNGQQRSNVLAGRGATSQQREQGSPGDAAADGRGTPGDGRAEREGGTDTTDDNLSPKEGQSRQAVNIHDPRSMSDEEKQRRGEMLRDATAVEVAEGQIVSTAELSARKAAEKWWQDHVSAPAFYDTEAGEVEINQKSIEDSLAHRYGQAKLDAITSLVDGFENAVYLGSMQDFVRQEGVVNHYFAYPIIYKGERCYVFCRAMQDENKNRLYVHEVFIGDKINKGNTLQTAAFQPHGGIALYRDILANVLNRSTSGGKVTDNSESTQEKGSKSAENRGVRGERKTKESSQEKKSSREQREGDKLFFEQFKEDSPVDDVPEKKRAAMRKFAEIALNSKNAETKDYPTYSAKRSSVEIPANKLFQSERKWFGVRTGTIAFHDDAHGCSYEFIAHKDRKGFLISVTVVKFHDFKGAEGSKKKSGTVKRDGEDVSLADVFEGTHYNPAADFADWSQWKPGDELEYNGYRSRFVGVDKEDGHVVGVVVEHLDDAGNAVGKETVPPLMFLEQYKRADGKVDHQGNPLNADGTLKLERVESVDELADEDFTNPTRNVELPMLPENVDAAIGADGKPVIIKKNIFEKNWKSHKDLSPTQSREILTDALYHPNMYGQNQKMKRPYNWILIHNAAKHSSVILEVSHNKDNVEIVNWHYLDDATLRQKERQAAKEGGLILTLESAAGDTHDDLSSAGKGTKSSQTQQEKGGKTAAETAVEQLEAEYKAAADHKDETSLRWSTAISDYIASHYPTHSFVVYGDPFVNMSQEEKEREAIEREAMEHDSVLQKMRADAKEEVEQAEQDFLSIAKRLDEARKAATNQEEATATSVQKVMPVYKEDAQKGHEALAALLDGFDHEQLRVAGRMALATAAKLDKLKAGKEDWRRNVTEDIISQLKARGVAVIKGSRGVVVGDRVVDGNLNEFTVVGVDGNTLTVEDADGERSELEKRSVKYRLHIADGGVRQSKSAGNAGEVSHREAALRDALVETMRESGMAVSMDAAEEQRVLDEANEKDARMSAKRKRALETASVSQEEEHQPTVVSSADGAKVLNNLDTTIDNYEKRAGRPKTFLGDVAEALGARRYGSGSEYATFETKNGKVVTIRLSNHNVTVSNFDYNGKDEGISIVVSAKKNEGITNDGNAHITEFFYDAIKLRRAEGKPLADIVRSIKQVLYSGEFHDPTGLAERQEVNGGDVRFFRTRDGEAYGFTVGGKIYIDPRIANSETPVHEYAHLWATALRKGNPKEWANVVELMQGTRVWDEVKAHYPELQTDDEIADEVLATYSGREGAKRLRAEMRKAAEGEGSLMEKAEAVSALARVREALRRFWKATADFLHIHYTSAEEVADRVMKDLLDGVDPRQWGVDEQMREQFVGERGAAVADHAEEVSTRMDNLRVAREIEAAQKDAKAIKQATGWERGADGKWRYEIEDIKYHPKGDAEYQKLRGKQPWSEELDALSDRLFDGEQLTEEEMARFDELAAEDNKFRADFLSREKNRLADWVENKELFAAYPELKNMEIVFTDQLPDGVSGYYAKKDNRMVVSTASEMDTESVIAHELQHAIQHIEGFARGGNTRTVRERIQNFITNAEDVSDYAKEKLRDWALMNTSADKLEYLYKKYISSDTAWLKEKAIEAYWDAMNEIDNNPNTRLVNDYPDGTAEEIAESGYHVEEAKKELRRLAQEAYNNIPKGNMDALELVSKLSDALKAKSDEELYTALAGEVESRNVQSRMGLTPEERREKLASETEDVAREDQLFLYGDGGVEAMEKANAESQQPQGREDVDTVNDAFNEQLEQQINGILPEGHVYRLGKPGEVLLSTGVPNLPIQLSAKRLQEKATMYDHDFDLSEVKDLVKALQTPLAIFSYGNKSKAQNIIIPLQKDGKHFIVGLSLRPVVNGQRLEINSIRNVFPKDNAEWLNWVNQGKALYLDKEKVQTLINQQQTNLADVEYLDLNSVAKVVEDFENPKLSTEKDGADGDLYRVVDDAATVERLDREPKVTAYRAMQVIDGRLYSPMAAKVDGQLTADNPMGVWTEAEETLLDFTPAQEAAMKALDASGKKGDVELVKGKLRYHKESAGGRGTLQFHLVKGDGTSLWAAYNPYIHSSLMMLNDQFTSAYKRPNIVVVEVEIPKSELTSGYRAARAKDAVGVAQWKAGPVAGQLPSEMGRKVILSRWSKVKRVVPYVEVADQVASILEAAEAKKGEKLRLPIDSFHPELRKALEARGFNPSLSQLSYFPFCITQLAILICVTVYYKVVFF